MSQEEFLSQEEVDALLKGVTGEADAAPETPLAGGVRPYDLATQERIVRGRMPTLEIINERFARLLRAGIFNFMRRSAEISVGPVKVQKYSEFIRNLPVPTNLNLIHIKPLRGTALFIFDPQLIFLVVDTLFGGDGRFHMRVEGRDFTPTEQRIIRKLVNLVLENYGASWKPVFPVEFQYVRAELHTQFANVATPNEVVVSTSFAIEFGAQGGNLHICTPYSMIEPVRDLLSSPLQGEALEVDKRWVRLLSQQVQAAEVELQVDLAQIRTTFRDIVGMRAGDVIPIDMPETVTAKVDGVPVMDCTYGIFNGQYALRVSRMIGSTDSKENGYD
ncbi:flagellar motor switch protein FliM [Chitinasiproducens palmae]|uniref:Flagellar motor switch protein FliM n=1 Tax=Chitinasiproducens palmae TaxID=1770053 RepID=A0A1H2PJM0_9BURK|nr:flagellar motor switch protein FliM [Chitinasiproducens palmae]SDV46589.1 flagellar motor switch protein FliM [Chitinasiproducens palmae]